MCVHCMPGVVLELVLFFVFCFECECSGKLVVRVLNFLVFVFQVEWPKPDKDNVVHMDWYVCMHLYDCKRMLKLGTRTILYKYIHVP